ncbi:MAG: SMC-Scp complex subunit ScpB [Acidobacteriota bacterium]
MGPAAHMLPLLEALLFVSERSISPQELASFLPDCTEKQIREQLTHLAHRHATGNGGLQVEEVAGGFRLTTRPDLGEAIKEFFRLKNRHRLSRAALETIAIIAYKQPVTHPEIQEIRGVSAEGVLKTLLERRLIKIGGRRATVGKPMVYKTTRTFLEYFSLASLDDLPPMEEFGQLLDSDEEAADDPGPPKPPLEDPRPGRREMAADRVAGGPGGRSPQPSLSRRKERAEPPSMASAGSAGETPA